MRRVLATALVLLTVVACGGADDPVVAAPGCATRRPALRPQGRLAEVAVGEQPFGVVVTPDGRHAFVALPATIVVLDRRADAWVVRRRHPGAGGAGLAVTPDGRRLLVGASVGVVVLDVARLLDGSDAEVGRVALPEGAIQVAVSPDGRTGAASEEGRSEVAVFDLGGGDPVRSVAVDDVPVGLAFASDRRLLVVSELRPGQSRPTAADPMRPGSLQVLDRQGDRWARVASVPGGCSPVRVAVSGRTAWVTARGSDALLAFDLDGPKPELRAWVPAGRAPVGVAVGGGSVVVAGSDRFGSGGRATVSVLDAAAARRGRARGRSYAAGPFPRDVAMTPDGSSAVVTEFDGGAVAVVPVDHP